MSELVATISRSISPPSHSVWLGGNEDKFSALEAQVSQWLALAAQQEALFQKNVYDNPDAGDLDFRQHRQGLHAVMGWGEMIALQMIALEGGITARARVSVDLIDQKLEEFRSVFFAWHGTIEAQADIPESLKQAFREASSGDVVPFP